MTPDAHSLSTSTVSSMDRPSPRSRTRRFAVIGIGAGVVIALVVAALAMMTGDRTLRVETNRLAIASVEKTLFRDVIALRASAVPKDVVALDAAEGGRVDKVLAEVGD